jgi:hypothetical protein
MTGRLTAARKHNGNAERRAIGRASFGLSVEIAGYGVKEPGVTIQLE